VNFEVALRHLDGRSLSWGGGGDKTTIIGGRFIFADDRYPLLLDLLPSLLHFRVDEGELDLLVATIRLLANETQTSAFGSRAMIDRLADIFFIQSLRAYLLSATTQRNGMEWLGAVSDERLAKALRLMHNESDKAWTIATLAANVGMSRAVFAARFKEIFGVAPITYLTRHRLLQAQQLLQNSAMSVAQVAQKVGYESEASFNKVFKRLVGHTPSVFRKSRQYTG
jgi:AraC-like DNA-binding protein